MYDIFFKEMMDMLMQYWVFFCRDLVFFHEYGDILFGSSDRDECVFIFWVVF